MQTFDKQNSYSLQSEFYSQPETHCLFLQISPGLHPNYWHEQAPSTTPIEVASKHAWHLWV